jgi:hypothetical protein
LETAEENLSCGMDHVPGELAFSCDKNLIVGYFTPLGNYPKHNVPINDDHLDHMCAEAGINGFNYICYPVAGISRASQYPNADSLSNTDLPPVHVNLSDIQIARNRWTNYVNCYISPWIDCDHSDPEIAKYSMRQLDLSVRFSFNFLKILLGVA